MTTNRALLPTLLAAAALLALAAGCATQNTPTGELGSAATGTGAPATLPSGPTATTPAAGATTPGPTKTKLVLGTPKAAAEHLYAAWQARDTAKALLGASASAVTTLFAHTWTSGTYFFGGCTMPTAPSECDYNWSGGIVAMKIDGSASAGFRVTSVSFGNAG
jgi:hypothetical protein